MMQQQRDMLAQAQAAAQARARAAAGAAAGAASASPTASASPPTPQGGLPPEALRSVYYAAIYLTRRSQLQLLAAFPPRAVYGTTFAEHVTVLFQPGAAELTPAVLACVGREVELEVYAVPRLHRSPRAVFRFLLLGATLWASRKQRVSR